MLSQLVISVFAFDTRETANDINIIFKNKNLIITTRLSKRVNTFKELSLKKPGYILYELINKINI